MSEATLPHESVRFAHNQRAAVRQAARLLRHRWQYEPRTFVLERIIDGNPVQAFTPDFYLPAYDLYIEITTLNQKLVTKKNRKARELRELHPEVQVKVLYQRDYLHLLVKYGLEPPSQLSEQLGDGAPLRRRRLHLRRPSASSAGPEPSRPEAAGRRLGSATVASGGHRGAAPQPARRRTPCLGARMVPFGGWEMPIQYTSVSRSTAPAGASGRVRRVAPRSVRVAGSGAFEQLQWALTNDLGSHRAREGRSTRTCSTPTTRTSSTTSSSGGSATDEFLVMPNASNTDPWSPRSRRARRHAGGVHDRRRHGEPRRARGPGPRRPQAGRRCRRGGPTFPVRSVQPPSTASRAGSPAPATPARTASSCTCRPSVGAGVLAAPPRRRHPAGRPRRPRHAAARSRSPAARPRARSRHHAAQAGLSWVVRFDKGDFRRPGPAGRRARPRHPPATARPRPRRAPDSRAGYAVRMGASAWARSRAATSRPCSNEGSPSRSSVPTSTRAPRSPSTSVGDQRGDRHKAAVRAARQLAWRERRRTRAGETPDAPAGRGSRRSNLPRKLSGERTARARRLWRAGPAR